MGVETDRRMAPIFISARVPRNEMGIVADRRGLLEANAVLLQILLSFKLVPPKCCTRWMDWRSAISKVYCFVFTM